MTVSPAACLVFGLLLAAALASSKSSSSSYQSKYPPPLEHKMLKFNKQGKFKIMQIADIHYQPGGGCYNIRPFQLPCTNENSTALIEALLDIEKPDLAIFTGDNVWYPFNKRLQESQDAITAPLRARGIPWMMTYGNHDCEAEPCQRNLTLWDMKHNLSLTRFGPEWLHGTTNYAYTIAGRNGKPAHVLYVLDSGAIYETAARFQGADSGSYAYEWDFIWPNQVDWYNRTSLALEKKLGRKLPATAWFHIALPEWDLAYACSWNAMRPALNSSASGMGRRLKRGCNGTMLGSKNEETATSTLNGGLFSTMVVRGDVRMANIGHDHNNDYCASLFGIRLCNGGAIGYYGYGLTGFPRRARFVELDENGTITTYKRLDKWGNFSLVDYEVF